MTIWCGARPDQRSGLRSSPTATRGGARRDRLGRLLATLPGPAQTLLRLAFVAMRVTAGPRSFLVYLRLSRIRRHVGSGGRVVRMRLRPLRGAEVRVRPSTSDVDTVWGTFAGRYHLPPPEAERGGIRLVWDLGANIGLTMADIAERHPGARVVGVELDAENVAIARANLAPYGDRCEVVEGAVWPSDGELAYVHLEGVTSGHHVTAAPAGSDPAVRPVPAVSPGSLLEREGAGTVVDYAKVDVEGAERDLLREATEWARSVRSLQVEVHDPYTVAECERDLRALGFHTRLHERHAACVVAFRQD